MVQEMGHSNTYQSLAPIIRCILNDLFSLALIDSPYRIPLLSPISTKKPSIKTITPELKSRSLTILCNRPLRGVLLN